MDDVLEVQLPLMMSGELLDSPISVELLTGQAVAFTRPSGGRVGTNEDALGIFEFDSGRVCLAVADGVGGMSHGREAAGLIIQKIRKWTEQEDKLPIDEYLATANEDLLQEIPRSGTTISCVVVDSPSMISCHAGDSTVLVVGSKGRVKLKVDNHSPVGISETLGLINEDDALHHPKRHYLNNMLGDPAVWFEKRELTLDARDTIILASDGLWDNLYASEIVDIIRTGDLLQSAKVLAQTAILRMDEPDSVSPSKPDDLTFVLYRPDSTGLTEEASEV